MHPGVAPIVGRLSSPYRSVLCSHHNPQRTGVAHYPRHARQVPHDSSCVPVRHVAQNEQR